MDTNPKVIITKNGVEREIPKITWEVMGKATDGWSFVRNADENDKSLPSNVKSAAKAPEFIPEEVRDMQTLRKEPQMKIGKGLRDFSDDEIMKEYQFRNQTSDTTVITDRETKLVRIEKFLNSVVGLLLPYHIPKVDEDVDVMLDRVLKSFNDKKELLKADLASLNVLIEKHLKDSELTKDARTRIGEIQNAIDGLVSNQS